MNKKIALCFLTYDNLSQPELWKSFLNSNFNVYIHNKYDFNGFFSKYCIKNKIPTEFGDISLVKATLLLFKEAFKNTENEYFILLSDKCIPLYNADKIYNEIININSNIVSLHSHLFNNKELFEYKLLIRYNLLKNKLFFNKNDFKKQSQWLMLKRDTVKFFIDNDFTHIFGNNYFASDEHYFINIMIKFNIPFIDKNILTYVNWNENSDSSKYKPLPKTYSKLTNKIVQNVLNTNCLFLRKIPSECILPSYFDKIIKKKILINKNYLKNHNLIINRKNENYSIVFILFFHIFALYLIMYLKIY